MDFKVTGTKDGITATQMDIKVRRTFLRSFGKSIEKPAKVVCTFFNIITDTIAEPRAELKDHAPRIETMIIPKDMIGAVIGPGGKLSKA